MWTVWVRTCTHLQPKILSTVSRCVTRTAQIFINTDIAQGVPCFVAHIFVSLSFFLPLRFLSRSACSKIRMVCFPRSYLSVNYHPRRTIRILQWHRVRAKLTCHRGLWLLLYSFLRVGPIHAFVVGTRNHIYRLKRIRFIVHYDLWRWIFRYMYYIQSRKKDLIFMVYNRFSSVYYHK